MIEKMKFLSITGPKEDIDRVVDQYLTKYPIHLENALSELSSVQSLYPYMEVNPYKDWLTKAKSYARKVDRTLIAPHRDLSIEEAVDVIQETNGLVGEQEKKRDQIKEELKKTKDLLNKIEPFRTIPFDIAKILKFRFIRYRFGRIPRENYRKFERFVYDTSNVIFYRCQTDADYVWGIYFIPAPQKDNADAVLASMHFERVYLPDSYEGTAAEAYDRLKKKCKSLSRKQKAATDEIRKLINHRGGDILAARNRLESMTYNFDVRKLAACTKDKQNTFYILCGWMTERDADAFQQAISDDERVYCIVEDPDAEGTFMTPPTKLKNPGIFRPFESLIRMYGLPSYHEIDPTIFVALTYAFIFGAMFGDLGQGLCLIAIGMILYRKNVHKNLGAVMSCAGIFSSFFGVMFGSFFGFENLISPVWLRPKEAMTKLPLIGNLNTVFIVAIAFGMFLILTTMVFHIINAVKAHEPGDEWFDTNGVAGLCFYGILTILIFLYMSGHSIPPRGVCVLLIVAPLLVVALKEPLSNLITGRRPLISTSVGMYIVETFFEMFETLLSFFSNTLSFVRIGAFAVSHAAMMEVVLMLAGAENGAMPNWAVVVIGNIFVIGLEGLIVGIQVLRLEYYEMFSRFYRGDGRAFKPFGKKLKAVE